MKLFKGYKQVVNNANSLKINELNANVTFITLILYLNCNSNKFIGNQRHLPSFLSKSFTKIAVLALTVAQFVR